MSKDSVKSHCGFRDKHALKVRLLSDEEGRAIDAYGCLKPKMLYGKSVLGIARTTFIIGTDQRIAAVFEDVTPEGHAVAILDAVRLAP